jgi:hypothetical protein
MASSNSPYKCHDLFYCFLRECYEDLNTFHGNLQAVVKLLENQYVKRKDSEGIGTDNE